MYAGWAAGPCRRPGSTNFARPGNPPGDRLRLIVTIWVTRTEPGATALGDALANAGHRVFKAPVLEIRRKPFDPPKGPFDYGVFLSVHGVRQAAASLAGNIPTLFAVGRQTQAALRELGFDAAVPAIETSEGLLTMLPDAAGKRVLVVTGAGGRNLLPETLGKLGAEVTRLEVYVRYPLAPAPDLARVDVIVVSSGDGLARTARLWLDAGGAADIPILAPSARVATLGAGLGMRSVQNCGGADAQAVLRTLRRLGFEKKRG